MILGGGWSLISSSLKAPPWFKKWTQKMDQKKTKNPLCEEIFPLTIETELLKHTLL